MENQNDQSDQQLIQLLLDRLERISADSHWAHRASGVRGGLLKLLDPAQPGEGMPVDQAQFLITSALDILIKAAKK